MLILSVFGIIILIIGGIFFFINYAKGSSKKGSYIIMIIGILIAGGAYGTNAYLVKQEQLRLAKIKKNKESNFASNYSSINYYASKTGIVAEKVGEKYSTVWHDAIWNDSVTVNGKSYTDFNKAVAAQTEAYVLDGTMSKMDDNLKKLNSTYSDLQKNVTDKNVEKLATAKQTVKDTREFVNTVENPSGNYSTFNNNVSDADSALSTDIQ